MLFSVEVTATYYLVSNLWRCFVGAIACIVCFQYFVDLDIYSQVPPTHLEYENHVSWKLLAFASLGAAGKKLGSGVRAERALEGTLRSAS